MWESYQRPALNISFTMSREVCSDPSASSNKPIKSALGPTFLTGPDASWSLISTKGTSHVPEPLLPCAPVTLLPLCGIRCFQSQPRSTPRNPHHGAAEPPAKWVNPKNNPTHANEPCLFPGWLSFFLTEFNTLCCAERSFTSSQACNVGGVSLCLTHTSVMSMG